MAKAIAFYAGLVYGEYDEVRPRTEEFPDGLYLRIIWPSGEIHWYIKQFGSMTPINHCDIPKNLLALCLILGLT